MRLQHKSVKNVATLYIGKLPQAAKEKDVFFPQDTDHST